MTPIVSTTDWEVMRETIEASFRRCFRYARLRHRVLHGMEADLLQAFYLLLLDRNGRVLDSFRGESSWSTWLNVVARRFLYREARRMRDAAHVPLDDVGPELEEMTTDSCELAYERAQEWQRVERFSRLLTNDERRTLALIVGQDGAAPGSSARTLGISPVAFRMRKARLLRRIEARLRDDVPHGEREHGNDFAPRYAKG